MMRTVHLRKSSTNEQKSDENVEQKERKQGLRFFGEHCWHNEPPKKSCPRSVAWQLAIPTELPRIPAFRGKHYFVFSTTCAGSKSKGWNPCVYFFRHRPGLREHCGPRSVNAVGSVDAGHQCKRFAAPSQCRSQTRLVHRICVVLTTSPAALPSPPCETSLAIRVKPLPALNHFINVCRFIKHPCSVIHTTWISWGCYLSKKTKQMQEKVGIHRISKLHFCVAAQRRHCVP